MVARARNDRDVGKGTDRRPVTGEAAGHALVDAGHRVERVVACGGVALGAGRRSRDVIGRFAPGADVACEGGRGRVAARAVAAGRVDRVVLGGAVIALSAHGGAHHHAQVLRALVTGLAAADAAGATDGRVAGGGERRCIDARGAELEATGVDVGRAVAT